MVLRAAGRLRRLKGRFQEWLAELRPSEAAGAVLTAFDGRTFAGVLSGVSDPELWYFDVFAEGRMLLSTRDVESRQFVRTGSRAWSFSFALPSALETGGPSVSVKHEGTDRFVDISPDLKGFVNNINESAVPSGHLLENPLFFLPVSRNRSWPPVDESLIRHVTGGATPEAYHVVGYAVLLDVLNFGVISSPNANVVEIGCGCGRVAHFLAAMLDGSAGGSYHGYDTWQEGIGWALAQITGLYPHAQFHHLGGPSESGYTACRSYRLGLPDASQDAVLAVSLFTHLRRQAAVDYIQEVARILRPGGKAYVTFFASKERFREIQPHVSCEEDDYGIYFVKPEFEDAFVEEAQARSMFERNALQVLGVKYGHWRGPKYAFRGHHGYQDLFVLKKT